MKCLELHNTEMVDIDLVNAACINSAHKLTKTF